MMTMSPTVSALNEREGVKEGEEAKEEGRAEQQRQTERERSGERAGEVSSSSDASKPSVDRTARAMLLTGRGATSRML